MVLKILDILLPGVTLLECPYYLDCRGSLTKYFHDNSLKEQGIVFKQAESFLTKSSAGVLRGMHFQVGSAAHDKLVTCIRGSVIDVIVDIRPHSPNFNQPASVLLNESEPRSLLIGKGYAHGFYALENNSWLNYSTSTVHQPEFDRGVLWSSIDFDWPSQNPLLSVRDQEHPPIDSLL